MNQENNSNIFIYTVLGLIIIVILGLVSIRTWSKPTPAGAAALAQCLTDTGVKFYGASWCSHCAEQKAMFGGAVSKLPYVECADGSGQTAECTKAGIEGYPTWVNAKGEKLTGAHSFQELADFSGCVLAK